MGKTEAGGLVEAGSTGVNAAWPLVGRASTLRDLSRMLRRPLPAGVLVSGEAGVGKTRLLAEFADRAASASWAVESVTGAISSAEVPMSALAQLVPQLPLGAADPALFMAAIREELLARHKGERLLLVVDDAPRLDAVSASFLAQLAVMGYCLVACTARTDEVLAPPIKALIKDQLLDEVRLGPLADTDVKVLVRTSLDGTVDPLALARLVRLSEGNPLFLREILVAGLESGGLTQLDGRWVFEEPVGSSPGVRRLVEDRVGKLSDDQRAGLEALTVAEPLELRFATELFDVESLSDLERRGIVRVVADGRRNLVEFVHPLLADVIRAGTPVTVRRGIGSKLLQIMEAVGAKRHEDVLRMALWHLDSGHPLDAGLLLDAAHKATASFDAVLGERLARAAVDAGAGPYAQLACAEAVSQQSRIEEAEQLVAEVDLGAADEFLRTSVLLTRIANLALRGGDYGRAVHLLEEGRRNTSGQQCLARVNGLLAVCQAFEPDPQGALETALGIIDDPEMPEEAVFGALTVATLVELWLCQFDAFEAHTARGLEMSGRVRSVAPDAREKLVVSWCNAQTYNGGILQAESRLRREHEEANTPPLHPFAPFFGVWLADTLSIRGLLREAVTLSRGAMVWSGIQTMGGVQGLGTVIHAVVAGRAGDRENVELALDMLGESLLLPPKDSWRLRAQAWQQAMRGDYTHAAALALEAANIALDVSIPLVAAWVLHEAVMFGHPAESVQPLREIAEHSGSPTFESFAAHASALNAADSAALTGVAGSFAARGELLFAARAYRQAAQLHSQAGDATRAVRAITKAQLLRPDTPDLAAWGLDTGHHLTARETEVARLAASGQTSQQIADRFYLSVRTVNNHLASVYTKLDVHSRDQLAAVLPTP